MFKVVPTNRFERKLKKIVSKSKLNREKLFVLLSKLSSNPFDNALNTHKLGGKLSNFFSVTCGFDCRIIFSFEIDANGEEYILLIDIGTHDEVY